MSDHNGNGQDPLNIPPDPAVPDEALVVVPKRKGGMPKGHKVVKKTQQALQKLPNSIQGKIINAQAWAKVREQMAKRVGVLADNMITLASQSSQDLTPMQKVLAAGIFVDKFEVLTAKAGSGSNIQSQHAAMPPDKEMEYVAKTILHLAQSGMLKPPEAKPVDIDVSVSQPAPAANEPVIDVYVEKPKAA